MKYIDKVNAAQMNAALERKAEIARKRRPLQESGYIPSSLDRTSRVKLQMEMKSPEQLTLDNEKRKIKARRKEIGQEFKHVKRDANGNCISVKLKHRPE